MCRLILMQPHTNQTAMNRLILHETLLAAQADSGQDDGWGITDGTRSYKTWNDYLRTNGIRYVSGFDIRQDGLMLAHVRKASRGTALSSAEAHPFIITPGGERWMAAHNGGISYLDDPLTFPAVPGVPNSDTYRALQKLPDAPLTIDMLTAWAGEFGPASEYTLMFLHGSGQRAHIIRKHRPMFRLDMKLATIWCTSEAALYNVAVWVSAFDAGGYKVTEVKPDTVVTVDISGITPRVTEDKWTAVNQSWPRQYALRHVGNDWQPEEDHS